MSGPANSLSPCEACGGSAASRWARSNPPKPSRYDPVRDYGGYGIRTTRHGTAYIAGGNRGVRLELAKGGTILIGSERPEELVSAITR